MVERKTVPRYILGTIVKLRLFNVSLVLVPSYILGSLSYGPSTRLGFIHIIFDINSPEINSTG